MPDATEPIALAACPTGVLDKPAPNPADTAAATLESFLEDCEVVVSFVGSAIVTPGAMLLPAAQRGTYTRTIISYGVDTHE